MRSFEGEQMSDMDKKRDHVQGMYKSPGWKAKVRKMSDAQVVAIYLREISKAQDRSKQPKGKPQPKKESGTDEAPF
jgi:hypothetical protein